ncbi:hypothetical protein [Ekhidna sp.]|uniref:hypothetical protein n=1 Tax=Ekhidna sp. TaxID=2608089 RepID=UPI003BA8B3DB
MKNFRFLLIGAVAGGAFGAKIGAYLSNLLEVSASSLWINSGFIYGMFSGTLLVVAFLVAFAIAGYQQQPRGYSQKNMARA